MLDPRKMTEREVYAAYNEEVATIKKNCAAIRARGESVGQGEAMAMNEARRWLDNALDVCWREM